MFAHKDIWTAIDKHAANMGHSASSLARAAGLDPTAFNKSKRISSNGKQRWPSTESISKILGATNTPFMDFISLVDHKASAAAAQKIDIPCLPSTDAERDGFFREGGAPILSKWAAYEAPALFQDMVSLEITNDAYAPFLKQGHILIGAITKAFQKGQRLFVRLQSGETGIYDVHVAGPNKLQLLPINQNQRTLSIEAGGINWAMHIHHIILDE